jgi:hypothetical protein
MPTGFYLLQLTTSVKKLAFKLGDPYLLLVIEDLSIWQKEVFRLTGFTFYI